MSTGYAFNMFVANQGYHLESDVGFVDTNLKCGPVEREELFRCEMIEADYEENQRREKFQCKNKEWYY